MLAWDGGAINTEIKKRWQGGHSSLFVHLLVVKKRVGNGWKGSVGLLILGKEGLLEGGRSLAGQMDDWRELAGVADRKRLLLKPYGPG